MITIFTVPKPFDGHIGLIQRNAIESWKRLYPGCQIILFGDECVVAEVAEELNVEHAPVVLRNKFGTPLLNDVFDRAEQLGRHALFGFANSDIVLMSDFARAVDRVSKSMERFLLVGECMNLDLVDRIPFELPDWEARLHDRCVRDGKPRGANGIDFFVFRAGFYRDIPAFAIGRAWFDHWLIWKARDSNCPVVDVSKVVCPIHQNHDYSHVQGGQQWSYYGDEAQQNLILAGGGRHRLSLYNATHRLTDGGIATHWIGRFVPNSIQIVVRSALLRALNSTRPYRHRLGLRLSRNSRA